MRKSCGACSLHSLAGAPASGAGSTGGVPVLATGASGAALGPGVATPASIAVGAGALVEVAGGELAGGELAGGELATPAAVPGAAEGVTGVGADAAHAALAASAATAARGSSLLMGPLLTRMAAASHAPRDRVACLSQTLDDAMCPASWRKFRNASTRARPLCDRALGTNDDEPCSRTDLGRAGPR